MFTEYSICQMERAKLAREQQLREESQRDKEEMERKMADLQEQMRVAQDALVGGAGSWFQYSHSLERTPL